MKDSILINTITQEKFPDKYLTYKSWTINTHDSNHNRTGENIIKNGSKFIVAVDGNKITLTITVLTTILQKIN